ncbi:MAG: amidohydrolase family protein [Clostridiales bacterium]|nr:amidohydrolase family protein [Clostridiales bacterium]
MNKSVLFSDITIVTPHDGSPVSIQEHAYCSVSGNKIVYVGTSKEKAAEALKDSVEVFEYNGKNKILCPSFANAHGHTPMSIFRNIADDRSLQDWLFGQIIPREDKMVADDFYYGNLLTLAEMIEGGTACVANMYDGALLIAKGAVETGFRVQQTSMGKKCIDGKWSVDRASVDELNAFIEGEGKGLITHSLLVHSIYLYPEDFYKPLAELAKEYDLPVSVHISETITENENCQKSYGCSPVQKLDWAGLLNDRTVAAHCVHLTPEDRKILADRKVWVAHNPSSNMKLASGFADMVNMQKDGVRLCIGSDGAASNNN